MSPNPAEEEWRGFVVPGVATSRCRLFVPGVDGTLIVFDRAQDRPRPGTVPACTAPGRGRTPTGARDRAAQAAPGPTAR